MMDTNPFEAAFDIQRTAFEQTQQATLEAVEAQKDVAGQFAENTDAIKQAQRQGAEMSREAIHAYFDALGSINPDADVSELRTLVDEQFDAFEETHDKTWDAVEDATDDGVAGFEEAADSYVEFLDSSFDGLLDAHEQVQENATEATEQAMETASEMTEDVTSSN